MFSKKFSRYVKYGLFSSVAVGSAVIAVSAKINDGDYNFIPIVRLTRTAVTAVDIGRTYQTMLYSKKMDKTSKEYQEIKSKAHQIGAEKLLGLCKANKGVYIKVGQHVGALDYLLPNEYVHTLRILHKDAPQNSVEELYKVIKEDLHKEPEELFLEFDKEPLGTASLAQVHRAKLKDGTEVAVKVQHYFVKYSIDMDLKWMELVINTMSVIFPDFQMGWLIDETKRNIAKELDFVQEGINSEKMSKMFSHYKWLKVPKVYWDYTCPRILVMDYVHGGQINDINYINEHKINKMEICRKLGDLYSHMIFVTGFVHADPHPGNILLRKDPGDKEVSVYLLDHGLYAQLSDKFRYNYSKLWSSIIHRNRDEMKIYSQKLGIDPKLSFLFACMVTGRPWKSIIQGIDKTKITSDEKDEFQNELPNFLSEITQCLEHVDRQALLVLKTNDLIRSIEYGLGLHNRKCGFMVMAKCVTECVYRLDYQREKSIFKKQFLNLNYHWSLLMLYLYGIYLKIFFDTSIA